LQEIDIRMSDSARSENLTSGQPTQQFSFGAATRFMLNLVVAITAAAWLGWLLIAQHPVTTTWSTQALLAGAALLASAWGGWHRLQHWTRPMKMLRELLPQVRNGEAPIEELSGIGGGLRELVPVIQDLMRDLRQQRAEYSHLQEEMRQRVAHRTDALERLVGSLRQQATKDALTGLYNRRMLDQHLHKVIERCREDRSSLCVLVIDVDNFKLLNDTRGHAHGDEFLRSVAQLIRSTIREQDVAFRVGGDEFVVLLPACDERNARAIADRLSSLVDSLGKATKLAKPPGLSIGLSIMQPDSLQTADELLTAGDKNLYEVKAARKQPKTASPARISA
jgi:diguanylate cyclase (GGDEF)-like protein